MYVCIHRLHTYMHVYMQAYVFLYVLNRRIVCSLELYSAESIDPSIPIQYYTVARRHGRRRRHSNGRLLLPL